MGPENSDSSKSDFVNVIRGVHGNDAAERYLEGSSVTLIRIIPDGEIGNLDPEPETDGPYKGRPVLEMTQSSYDNIREDLKKACRIVKL